MKTCFRCNTPKDLSEFYAHPSMKDGHLNKCISCAKSDVSKHRAEHLERHREYDRSRNSLPHRIAAVQEYQKTARGRLTSSRAKKKYHDSNPRKTSARSIFSNAIRDKKIFRLEACERCGNPKPQGHHENYDYPMTVVWLCSGCHATRHKEMRKLGIAP